MLVFLSILYISIIAVLLAFSRYALVGACIAVKFIIDHVEPFLVTGLLPWAVAVIIALPPLPIWLLAMGKVHWRDASVEQRESLSELFENKWKPSVKPWLSDVYRQVTRPA